MSLAEQVLEQTSVKLTGADVDVYVEEQSSALTRFANSFIHQNVDEEITTIRLRVHHDGRTVALSTTLTDVPALVERARALLTLAPRDPGWPGVSPALPLLGAGAVDVATRDCGPEERAGRVRDFVAAGAGMETAGYCRTSSWRGSFRSSAGQSLDASATDSVLDGIVRRAGADGVARRESHRLSDLDGAELGARARESVLSQAEPVELPPGKYEVVLLPEAVGDLLNNFAMFGFNGKAFLEGRSFAKLGEAQLDPAITVYDSPFAPVGGLPFDVEGTPRSRLTLVDKGVTVAVAHDRRTGAEAGLDSTGHAHPDGGWGPTLRNPGFAAGDAEVDAMIASMKRGILVADFWYTRVLDPRTLVITGLTRNGAWLVENGEMIRPVRNFRFTQAYPQALGPGNVLAVGAEVAPQPNRYEFVNSAAPALHLASWNFTGGASG